MARDRIIATPPSDLSLILEVSHDFVLLPRQKLKRTQAMVHPIKLVSSNEIIQPGFRRMYQSLYSAEWR